MVRETRYLIVRNLPENCSEETVIDHFQRYGKIQSVKLQPPKDNDAGSTATVAFNDIKSAAKAHHAKNNIGDVTLRTDYWEGSTGTPVLASAPVVGSNVVRSSTYASATAASSRLVSTFSSWNKGNAEEDASNAQDKGDITLTPAPGIIASAVTASTVLDKLSSTAYDLQRGRGRDRIKQKKFGQKFEKSGSFGRHGTTTSSRSLEAARSQSEAAAAAAAAVASSTAVTPIPTGAAPPASSSAGGNTAGLNPIIVCDTKDLTSRDLKDSNRESSSRSRPHSVASPSSRNSCCVKILNSQSRSVSRSRSQSQGSASSSSRSHSSGTSRSTSPHRSHTSSTTRPQSMVGTSRLVNSEVKDAKRDDGDTERRPLGICVTGLPIRSTDSSLRDGLFHEYKKQGKVTAVQICGDGENRCAIISFRKPEDASKALEASHGKIFFGEKIKVSSHEGIEVDDNDRSNDNDTMDEYHVKSTRTLFVGNLEKETTMQDLQEKFKQFGDIIDVDIKRQGASTAFAFVQYVDIVSVVAALREMEGEHIGINKIKLGFGKSMPTCCVWLDNLPSDATNRSLRSAMSRYGEITYCCIDRNQNKGLVYFTSYEDAQRCVSDIKLRPKVLKKKLQVDFASRECQTHFLDRMEKSGQMRANERPDESRGHKFRQQRSFDSFQEDGSPSAYGFTRTSSSFNARNGRSSSGSTSYRRSRQYGDSNFQEENHCSSRRSRRTEEFSQSGQFYSNKGSSDDYDIVLREYGHSQRERRERDLSPRHSVDRRVDNQSRQSSRDHSLDRYEKDRTIEIYNSRDTSPDSEHNSFHSESRYRSSRNDKYSSRDRYDDSKAEEKDFDRHSRQSHNASPYVHNHSSSHSHDSDYEHRGGSRSQSPPTPIQEDSSMHRIYYADDYKRSVEVDDDFNHYSSSQKQKDSDDIISIKSKTVSLHSTRLGAEVIKTAGKNRKRSHEESGLSDLSKLDSKLLRKSDKSGVLLHKDKKHHYETSRQNLKGQEHTCSPGSSGSHGDSENGSVSEGDLHHLHQEKHHILRKLQELNEEGVGTSEPDSPRSVARVKSVAVKDALRLSRRSREERKSDDPFTRGDTQRRQSGKLKSSDSRRESRNHISDEMSATREDKNLLDEKEESFGGNSDSDYGSDFKRIKKRRTDSSLNIVSTKDKGSRRPSSVEVSEDELDKKSDQSFRMHSSSSVVKRVSCDSRVGSKSYSDSNKTVEVLSCDNGDLFKGGLSDNDISVIKESQTVSKSETYFPNKSWNVDYSGHEPSPVCFSPAYSEEHTQDSVTSGSLTEKSYKHLSPHSWQHSPPASIAGKDNSDGDYSYYKEAIPDSTSPDDCLSDDSLGEDLQTAPGEPSVEERIRAIDEMLNMTVNKSSDSSLLISALSNRDITNNNDNSALYSKFRIRKREGGLDGGNGSLLMDKKPEPSVIMQQVLSKKSILDQDQKRLEQMNEKYDNSGRKDISAFLNSGISSPKLTDLKMEAYSKPLLSPSLFSSSWSHPMTTTPLFSSSSSLSSSHPVTTSSSMLHPTVTTSASCVGYLSVGVLTTSIVSAPVITSSIYSSAKPTVVDSSKRSIVRSSEHSEDVLDRYPVCTHSLTLKQNITISSFPSSSVSLLTFSNSSSLSSLSPLLSSTIGGSSVVTESTSTASQQSCKFTVSSPLPSPLLSQPISSTTNISISSAIFPKINQQQNVLSSSYTSSLSSSSSVTQSPIGAPVAAPFTQGPDKSQLTPTVGQEAPRLCSPSFTPENSRTSVSSHLPESRSPRISIQTDDPQKTTGKTDLKVSVSIEGDSRTSVDELKSNSGLTKSEAVTPDIESPISVKSETSSIASVPLSSVDSKAKLHVEEKVVVVPHTVGTPSAYPRHSSGHGSFSKSPDQSKTLSPDFVTEKTLPEVSEKGQDILSDSLLKGGEAGEAADLLFARKTEPSPNVNIQTVLSVGSKDNSEKELSDLPDTSNNNNKGKLGSSSSVNSDTPLKLVSSSAVPTPSTSVSTVGKSSLDKSEKRVPGKITTNYKTSGSPAKSEALFAPDVKMEQPVKSTENKSDVRHQSKDSARSSSNKSSSSDKKSAKVSSKDGLENKDLQNSKEADKSEKRTETGNRNPLGQDSSKSREANKVKDKRDQSKDGEKTKPKEDSKKKEDKKSAEKKGEKRNQVVKDDKKGEKRAEEKKDKSIEKSKDSSKSSQSKQKQDMDGSKQDKKQKEKPRDTGSKDKEKSTEKKTLAGFSCTSKQGTPEVKQESKPVPKIESKDSKSVKADSVRDVSVKSEKEESQKSETPVKSEQKTARQKSENKETSKALSISKSDSRESQTSAKKSLEGSKSKKEQDKQSDKILKQRQRDEEKQRLKEEKERQKQREEKEKEEREAKEREEREKQREKEEKERKEKEEKERRDKEEKEKKEEEEKERQKEKERKEKERKDREREEREQQKEKEREEREREREEKEEKERQKEKEREEKEKQKEKEKEEKERQKERKEKEDKERMKKEKEEREKQRQKERDEKESQKEKERLDKKKEKEEKQKEKEEKQKEKEEKQKEKEEKQKEKEEKQKEKEEKQKEKEEKQKEKEEKQKEKEEKQKEKEEKQKEKEEKQKEKEEKQKEKEEKQKEKEEKQKEKEEKQKEKEEKQKEKEEKQKEKEDKQKEKEKKEKEKKEKKEMEKKEKEKKAKEEKLKKEKEERVRKEKDERTKKDKEEKSSKEKDKMDKDKEKDEKKKPAPKKPKRNELAALLEQNDMIQMCFTSMYDRVKTQRNREPEQKPEPAPKSSFDKFKQNRKKNGSKVKSPLYSFDTSSDASNDDLSSLSDSEPTQKTESVKETKPKKTKQIKKRPHVSSSSSSCEEDDDALLRASKPKGKKNEIFSSDSDDSFQPASNKQKSSVKAKAKPAPKKRKTRNDSSDSITSREDFLKSQATSGITDSLDEIDMSEEEDLKTKPKVKAKSAKASEKGKDSSHESVKKVLKTETDSSTENLSKKSAKIDKEESSDKKTKSESKKTSKTHDIKSETKSLSSDKKKGKHSSEKGESIIEPSSKHDADKSKSKLETKSKSFDKQKSKGDLDSKSEAGMARSKTEVESKSAEKPKPKIELENRTDIEKPKLKLDADNKHDNEKSEKSNSKVEPEGKHVEKSKSKIEPDHKFDAEKPKAKSELEGKPEDENSKSKIENESKVDVEKSKFKTESESRSDIEKPKSKDKSENKLDGEKSRPKVDLEIKSETEKSKVESENKTDAEKPKHKLESDEKPKSKDSNDGRSKAVEKKKKNEDDSLVKKKKKKKKYDPLIEEQLVNSLITKVYDKVDRDKKEKKKSKVSIFDSEPEDTSHSETSFGVLSSLEEKTSIKDSEEPTRPNEVKTDHVKSDKHLETKPSSEGTKVLKKDHKKNKEKREHTKEVDKIQEVIRKDQLEKREKEKAETEVKQGITEELSDDEQYKPPKKKKKKKEHSRDNEKEKEKSTKVDKTPEKKPEIEKIQTPGDDKNNMDVSGDNKSSSQIVDEFTSFWGHPKPILIPKRLKNSNTDEEKSKHKDHKDEPKADGSSDKTETQAKSNENNCDVKDEKMSQGDDKSLDVSSCVDKTPESATTPKVESELGDDCIVPISEAETTVITETAQTASGEENMPSADSVVTLDELASGEDAAVLPDETTIGSSVEIDDDDFPSLVIDEIPESTEKKVTKKDKKLLKEQMEKERNDHMDEVIASVAMAMSSDDEDAACLLIDTACSDQELLLSDIINQELKYDNKTSSEPEQRPSIVSDIAFPDKDKKEKQADSSSTGAQKDKDARSAKKDVEKKKDAHKSFGPLDEETKKRDEELLKTLAVLCDPNLDKPVVIEDIKQEPSEEEIKKREEEEKKKAEEERKRAEEEEKSRREKEEQEMREASDEAARAVESILEFQSGYDQESLDMDDDLPPLIIEPAEKESPVETVCVSHSGDKVDIVSIFSSPIPDKVTANLDDKLLDEKLLDEKLNEKGAVDQADSKLNPFNIFATPTPSVAPAPVFTSPRRNSAGVVKDKTPDPIMLPSPQKQLPPSPQKHLPPSPQMHSPHRVHFTQRPLQSPQHQMPSPQKSVLSSQIDLQSPQPLLQSPQRSPFFGKDTKMERNFLLTNIDVPSSHPDIDIPLGQPRNVSTNLPVQAMLEQPLRPMQVSPRRKSQEFPSEQFLLTSRRNTIAAPEEATVTHLDRRFQPPMGSSVIYSKERTHGPSSLPPPVSISLDHAPHDRSSQSPMPSLIIPPHQENVLLAPRKVSPAIQFKECTPEPQIFSSPNKSTLPEQLLHFPKGPVQEHLFTQQPKGPTQEQLFYGAKGPSSDFFKTSKIEPQILLPSKSPISEKQMAQPQVKVLDSGLMQQKTPTRDLLLPHSKGAQQHLLDQFPQHGKGLLPREPLFSPKIQPDNSFSYPEQNIDFLLNSPPRGNVEFSSYPPSTEVNMPTVSKPQDYNQDPLLIPVSEPSTKHQDREISHAKRVEGFPASFYQEPIAGPKVHQEPAGLQQLQQQTFEDDKKGTRKRKRNSRKASNEDKAAALAKQQAIEESVQANVDSIRKALTANQAKAAAEKSCVVGNEKKKPLDAYDFEAHIGQDVGMSSGSLPNDTYPSFGEADTKPIRFRNDRGRGRGYGARRGRRGKGALSSVHEPADAIQRPDPLQHPQHFLAHVQSQDHLHPHIEQQYHQQFPPSQQQKQPPPPPPPPFQRQTSQQPNQAGQQIPHFYQHPHPSPLSSDNSSSMSASDWQQKQIPQTYQHSQLPQQPVKLPVIKSDMFSTDPNKQQDLDLSFGESELIINLDDPPPSNEGKENQYNLSSDGEDRGLIPSPSTPKSQRSTRARKQPDYKAIASGNVQPPAQPRTSRSGGSPRGRGNGAQSPKNNMSPRTRSTENISSSPVVKLEKLEVGRTTRSRRETASSKGFGKDDSKEVVSAGTSFEDWKAKFNTDENKSISKENIYEFEDNEQDQHIETSLRSARARKKRVSENQELQLQQQQQLPDYMPGSPTSSSNSSIFFQEPRHTFEPGITETTKSAEESVKPVPLSNVDAIIDAVSKGNFGSSEDDVGPKVTTPVISEPDPLPTPPPTRSTRRSTETKKEADPKAEKTFTIAEQPRFEGREIGRKGPTVPPLRIKVAHGTKVEKNEEKHYVIERAKGAGSASEHEKPPLAFTVKLSDSGTATIKPAGGANSTTANAQLPVAGAKMQGNANGEIYKNDNAHKKENNLGLFSGLPQNEPKSTELDLSKPGVPVSHIPSWKPLDTTTTTSSVDEAVLPRSTGAMHPKVAAKVQASQESQNSAGAAQAVQTSVLQYPPSSTPSSAAGLSKSCPVTPATPLGLKHAWSSGLPQDTAHQPAVSSDQPAVNSYHPAPHLHTVPQLPSREAQIMHQPQPSNIHQDTKQSPGGYNQPVLRSDRAGKINKPGGLDINPDLVSKMATESPKHLQGAFGFPPHVPPAHSGQRFMLPSDQTGHHAAHFSSSSLLKSVPDSRPSKSPSIQPQPAPKIGPEVRTQTPPVTPAMLYAGVVSGQPHSLSPTSASPEGQVIERIQNPIRQSESSQSSSPLTLHLPGSHHQDPATRFMKDDAGQDSLPPLSAHSDRTASQEMVMYKHIMEQQRLQQHLLMAEAARSAAQEAVRNSAPDPARNIAAMRNVLESSRNTPVALVDGGRKGPLPPSQAAGHGQPLNLTPQSDNRSGGQTDSSRGTPKSTPPAPQSPFAMQFFERKGDSSRLPVSVGSSFMQPSPSGHREGLPSHLYPELSLANLTAHTPYLVGRLPIDPRIFGTGQQPSSHLMRDGVHTASFPQAFSGSRFPGLEHPDGKKGDPGHPDQAPPHMLRSPSPIHRQLQADVLRQQLTRMPCDLPTRDSPVGFLQRYPVMWQGALALKNDNSYVQMHFIAGNRRLPSQALPQPMQNGALPPLRISQRMRLEHAQLEGVAKRMQCEDHYCILIAVACGRDQMDINHQTRALNEGFITYLLSKQAAGIVNVPLPGSEQVRFVVHIFPPCEFVDNSVAQQGSVALMEQLREVPHAVIIIATT